VWRSEAAALGWRSCSVPWQSANADSRACAGPPLARSPSVRSSNRLLDHEAYTQICDTRRLLDARLAEQPDDFVALALADVFAELDPERDPELRSHAKRSHALRGELGAQAWCARAREHRVDVLLFNLFGGLFRGGFGHAALPVLARRTAEISANPRILGLLRGYTQELGCRDVTSTIDAAIARSTPALAAGRIERAFVPEGLLDRSGVVVRFHPSGHLAAVRIRGDRKHGGSLVLDEAPGTAHLVYRTHGGGSGYVVDEHYRDGAIHATVCSPWHDGDPSTEPMEWSRWVAEALGSLENVARSVDR